MGARSTFYVDSPSLKCSMRTPHYILCNSSIEGHRFPRSLRGHGAMATRMSLLVERCRHRTELILERVKVRVGCDGSKRAPSNLYMSQNWSREDSHRIQATLRTVRISTTQGRIRTVTPVKNAPDHERRVRSGLSAGFRAGFGGFAAFPVVHNFCLALPHPFTPANLVIWFHPMST